MVAASQAVMVTTSDSQRITAKAAKGAIALGSRQVAVHGLNIAGSIALARLLSPSDFGIYGITLFLVQFLSCFGGTGLACSLIRVPNEPTEDEYSAVFAFQQLALACLVLGLWAASPYLVRMYGLTPHYASLFRMTAAALFITSFMVIPQVRLERELDFAKLAVVEIWQAVVFNMTAVGLAWRGWGGMSFAIALLVRSGVGVVAVYLAEPWKPHWRLDWNCAKPHLRFGFYYQSAQAISLIKDSISPVLIGALAGAAGVGYISWANMVATYPVLLLMILQRVYLPAFSRLQHDRQQLSALMEKILLVTTGIASPLAVLALVLIHPLTTLVFGSKWTSAIPMFFLFWSANLFVPASIPILGLLNAIGKSRLVFVFTLLWAGLTWLLGIPLILWLGPIGLAWATLGVQLSGIALFVVAKKELQFRILQPMLFPWTMSLVAGGAVLGFQRVHAINTVALLITSFAFGLLVYVTGMVAKHLNEIKNMWNMLRPVENV